MKKSPKTEKSPSARAQRQTAALHIILGLALLFLAGILLVSQVQHLRQGSMTLSQIIGFLGFLLFFLLGAMLLGGQIRLLVKKRAAARRKERPDHGPE